MNTTQQEQALQELEECLDKRQYPLAQAKIHKVFSVLQIDAYEELTTPSILHCRFGFAFADLLWRQGDNQEAESVAHHALSLVDQLDEQQELKANILRVLAVAYERSGKYQKALATQSKAVAQFRNLKMYKETALCLCHQGIIYKHIPDYGQALTVLDEALRIFEALDEAKGVASTLGNIANVLKHVGQYSQAIMYYESCLETWKKEGDLYNTAATLNNLALVYYLAEEHESSIKIYEEVGRIDRELGLRAEEIETRVNIGSSWRELKQYDKALQELQAALEMYEALGTDDKKASTQLKIVHVLIELKHFEEAEILCYSTLELEEKIGRKNQLGMIYGQLGYLHAQPTFENYNPTKSLDFYEKGVSLCEEIDASQYEHYIRKNYAVLLEHLGHFKEALYQVKRSYEIQTAVDKDKLKISLQASTLTALRQNTEDIQSSQSKVTILEDLVQEKQQALLAAERELEQWKAQAVPDQAESSGVEYSSQYYNNIVVVCIGVYGYDSGTPNDSSIVPQHQRYSNIIAEIYHLAEFHDMDIIQVVGNTFLVCAGIPDAGIASFEKVASFASSVLTFIERGSSEKTLPESTENASSAGVKIGAHYGAIIVDSITEYQTQYNLRGTTVDIVRQIQEQSELGQINASEGFAHKVYSQFTVTKYNEIAVVNAENTPERIKTFTIGEI